MIVVPYDNVSEIDTKSVKEKITESYTEGRLNKYRVR